ncbi:hypothetical protein D3C73_998500 [compost metagenome]
MGARSVYRPAAGFMGLDGTGPVSFSQTLLGYRFHWALRPCIHRQYRRWYAVELGDQRSGAAPGAGKIFRNPEYDAECAGQYCRIRRGHCARHVSGRQGLPYHIHCGLDFCSA